jgi:hypothetical protein
MTTSFHRSSVRPIAPSSFVVVVAAGINKMVKTSNIPDFCKASFHRSSGMLFWNDNTSNIIPSFQRPFQHSSVRSSIPSF